MEDYPLRYHEGRLTLDSIPLEEQLLQSSCPLYVYSLKKVKDQATHFLAEATRAGLPHPIACYALKANPHPQILYALKDLGVGADIVSGGELKRALECQIDPQKIVFSGVGKTKDELREALLAGILSINLESLDELEDLKEVARELKLTPSIAFRLNPAVNPKTHKSISTGEAGHKFGMSFEEIKTCLTDSALLKGVNLKGLSIHIGSQLTEMEATLEATQKLIELAHLSPTPLEFLDLGGGLGIDYRPKNQQMISVEEYMQSIAQLILPAQKKLKLRSIIFEPGRYFVARAGVLLTRVTRIKEVGKERFVIVDTGMHHLMRPALYEAYHHIIPLNERRSNDPTIAQTIVGPICETTDTLAQARELPVLHKGEVLALLDAGAYGASMSNDYNLREKAQEKFI